MVEFLINGVSVSECVLLHALAFVAHEITWHRAHVANHASGYGKIDVISAQNPQSFYDTYHSMLAVILPCSNQPQLDPEIA